MAEPNINIPERKTQAKVIKFFKDELHYDYLGNLCEVANKNIRDDDLFAFFIFCKQDSLQFAEVFAPCF